MGVQATLLQIGDERTGVVTGNDAAPEAVLLLEIGSRRVAREHFQRGLPTEAELERAIATIEDEVARAAPMLRNRSTLFTTDDTIRQIATTAGVPAGASMILRLELVEQIFGQFVSEALGQSPRLNGLPLDRESAATLMILREFMHHLHFASINVVESPNPMAPRGGRQAMETLVLCDRFEAATCGRDLAPTPVNRSAIRSAGTNWKRTPIRGNAFRTPTNALRGNGNEQAIE